MSNQPCISYLINGRNMAKKGNWFNQSIYDYSKYEWITQYNNF